MNRLRLPLALLLAASLPACSDDRRAASSCERYLSCLDEIAVSGGPAAAAYQSTIAQARTQYGAGGACDASSATRSQCEQACTNGLGAARQAFPSVSACGSGMGPGPAQNAGGGGSGPCKAYLSCVLATSPSQYSAALSLYGENAVCWDNAAQSAGCDSACTVALEGLTDVCSCTGSACTAYYEMPSGSYQVAVQPLAVAADCPSLSPMGPAMVQAQANRSGRIDASLEVSAPGPFGVMTYTDQLHGEFMTVQNGGNVEWTIGGFDKASSAFTLTHDGAFTTDLDRYGDGACKWRISLTKP